MDRWRDERASVLYALTTNRGKAPSSLLTTIARRGRRVFTTVVLESVVAAISRLDGDDGRTSCLDRSTPAS